MKHSPSSQPERARVKCLIVDDLQENLLALAALLHDDDVELLQARSGTQALELLLAHDDVALALLDVQMPEMDGFELAEIMRGSERTRDVPIIFVTAGTQDQHRIFKGYEAGAVDFLHKPIDSNILRSKAGVFFKLHRQKLQLARHLAERTEALRLQEMFTAVLGHDLRSPLSAMLMAAELLARRPDESVRQVGQRLVRSGRWMGRMIEDMLDLTRIRVGQGMPVQCQPFDLGTLAERVVQELATANPGRVVRLDAQGDLAGCWDEDRLTQVVNNLVGNALRHGTDAPVLVTLDGHAAEHVRLTVANGGSIAPDILPHIFDPFRSGRSHNGRSDGLGLGLYIAQQIVWAHGGALQVHSADGQTRFTAELPRQASAARPAPAA